MTISRCPGSLENRRKRHRLALAAGTIHAKTISQPGVFVIDTPKARAIDLGCEYTLTIAPNGGGTLHVIFGWVDLTHGYEQSLVPQGEVGLQSSGWSGEPQYENSQLVPRATFAPAHSAVPSLRNFAPLA